MSEPFIADKNRRPIHVHDIVKVFHFIGGKGNKRHYMYKQVCEVVDGKNDKKFYRFNHLTKSTDEPSFYWVHIDNKIHGEFEIVQGYEGGYFDDRKKVAKPTNDAVSGDNVTTQYKIDPLQSQPLQDNIGNKQESSK